MDALAIQFATTSDGVRIAYTAIGGSGIPVVHAPPVTTPSTIETMHEDPHAVGLANALAPELRMVRYDPRGSGASQRGPADYSPAGMARDIEAVVAALGVPRVALHMTGSGVFPGLRFAAAHPGAVCALVTMGAKVDGASWRSPTLKQLIEIARLDWHMFTEFWPVWVFGSADRVSRFVAPGYGARIRKAYDPAALISQMEALAEEDLTDLLPSVDVPALIIAGEADTRRGSVDDARTLASLLPQGRLAYGADAAWERRDDVLVAFLKSVVAAPVIHRTEPLAPQSFQTILFTDLESSTALTQRMGDEGAQEVLRGHNVTVRAALEAHGGREVKHTGDGIMAAFPSAVRAVEAALQIQRELAGGEVRVRVGLNAGEPIAEDNDLFGTAVQLAARICDRAEPGQVLVSNVVRELCAGKRLEFALAGDFTLKGFDEPVRAWAVRWEDS